MIIKRFILYLSIILMTIACNRVKAPEKPKNLISKEKMVDILIDAKIIASASSANKKILKNNGVDADTYVFKKHNIDSLQFSLSNNYYAFHIKDYEVIYAKVRDSLEVLKVKFKDLEAEEWKEKTKREEDSLKKAFADKDSLGLFEIEDGLKKINKKDSLFDEISKKKGLIRSVSDKEFQLQE